MSTFGTIKTNIEKTASELATSNHFKRFIFEFNSLILKNKDISELYYIYDDLSSKKSLAEDIADDYINESIEYSQILIETQTKNLSFINKWINSWNKNNENNYSDIDNVIYNVGIKNLESVLESKKNIKNVLIKEENKNLKENINLPLSSMVSIANTTISKNLTNLSENDKKELKEIMSLSKTDLKNEIDNLKETVKIKLSSTLNESSDKDLQTKINQTINKVMDTKYTHYDYYKLRKLSFGL